MSSPKAAKSMLYTRTGDGGESSLYTGERRSKADAVFSALGDLDELSCTIGVAIEHLKKEYQRPLVGPLKHVQCVLFDIGSAVATPSDDSKESKVKFDTSGSELQGLEDIIDHFDAELPPLKNFILPGGSLASASLHLARAQCRRCERGLVSMIQSGHSCNTCHPDIIKYINRLSDFLFCAARHACLKGHHTEVAYQQSTGTMTSKLQTNLRQPWAMAVCLVALAIYLYLYFSPHSSAPDE